MLVTSSFGPKTCIIVTVECSRVGMCKPLKFQFTDKVGAYAPFLLFILTLPLSSWWFSQTSVLSLLQTVVLYIASFHEPVNFLLFLSISAFSGQLIHATFSCTVYNQSVCHWFGSGLYFPDFSLSIELTTDSVMAYCQVVNELVMSKWERSISHVKGNKLHRGHCSLQQSAPHSYSAPCRCTLPSCVPGVKFSDCSGRQIGSQRPYHW